MIFRVVIKRTVRRPYQEERDCQHVLATSALIHIKARYHRDESPHGLEPKVFPTPGPPEAAGVWVRSHPSAVA